MSQADDWPTFMEFNAQHVCVYVCVCEYTCTCVQVRVHGGRRWAILITILAGMIVATLMEPLLPQLFLPAALWWYSYSPHFTDRKIEAS